MVARGGSLSRFSQGPSLHESADMSLLPCTVLGCRMSLLLSMMSLTAHGRPCVASNPDPCPRLPWQDYANQHMRFSNCINLTVTGPTVVYNSLQRLPFTQATVVGMSADSRSWTVQVQCPSRPRSLSTSTCASLFFHKSYQDIPLSGLSKCSACPMRASPHAHQHLHKHSAVGQAPAGPDGGQ